MTPGEAARVAELEAEVERLGLQAGVLFKLLAQVGAQLEALATGRTVPAPAARLRVVGGAR